MAFPPSPKSGMVAALRASAAQADQAAQTPDASSMPQDADSMTQQLCCPKCKFCGTEADFELPADGQGDQASPDTSPSPDDQSYSG